VEITLEIMFYILTSLSHYCMLIMNEWRALIFWCENLLNESKRNSEWICEKEMCVSKGGENGMIQ